MLVPTHAGYLLHRDYKMFAYVRCCSRHVYSSKALVIKQGPQTASIRSIRCSAGIRAAEPFVTLSLW